MLRKLNDEFQENLSRSGIIDARARYRAAAQRLRNTDLVHCLQFTRIFALRDFWHRFPSLSGSVDSDMVIHISPFTINMEQ